MRIIDATCPLVTKVHLQAQRYEHDGQDVILVGHPGHPEVEGTRGRVRGRVHVLSTVEEVEALEVSDPSNLAYVTQTTLSVDDTRGVIEALERRFPKIRGPELEDICYATTNRQNAVKAIAAECDLVIVVGAENSSNSKRLVEVALTAGARAGRLVADKSAIDWDEVDAATNIGLSAGASAPESLIHEIIDAMRSRYDLALDEKALIEENVTFKLPPVLTRSP